MQKKNILIALILLGAVVVGLKGAASSLLNATWVQMDGSHPAHWEVIPGNASITAQNGVLTLRGTSTEDCFLVQRELKLQPGTTYDVHCEIRSAMQSEIMFYMEYRNADRKLIGFPIGWKATRPTWKKFYFNFNLPSDVGTPYIVLRVRKNGQADFRNLAITAVSTSKHTPLLGGTFSGVVKNDTPFAAILGNHSPQEPVAVHSRIPVLPGHDYEYTFRIRGEGNSGHNTGFHFFKTTVEFPDKSIVDSGWDDTGNLLQNKKLTFRVPDGKNNNHLTVRFYSNTQGAMMVDQINLAERTPAVEEQCQLTFTSPAYRETFYSPAEANRLAGRIRVRKPLSNAQALVVDAAGNVLQKQNIHWNDGLGQFAFEFKQLKAGRYTLKLQSDGVELLSRNWQILPEHSPSVIADAQNRILVNGKPFFINMFWWEPGYGSNLQALRELTANGITTAMLVGTTTDEVVKYLDNCQAAGLMGLLNFTFVNHNGALKVHTPTAEFISSFIDRRIVNHPALLGYHLTDEPMWRGVSLKTLQEAYRRLRELDAHHPVWINAAPRGDIAGHRNYSTAADLYGLDIYPIPMPSSHSNLSDQNITAVGAYTKRMVAAVEQRKPILMTLQGFAWGDMMGNGEAVYPNQRELRFMCYDALTSGATGVGFWGMHYIKRPEFYSVLTAVTRELYQLSGFLAAGEKSQVHETDQVRIQSFTIGNAKLWIALNLSAQPRDVSLTGDFGSQPCKVWGENRCVTAQANRLQDHFEGYDVHLYWTGDALPEPPFAMPVTGQEPTEFLKEIKVRGK